MIAIAKLEGMSIYNAMTLNASASLIAVSTKNGVAIFDAISLVSKKNIATISSARSVCYSSDGMFIAAGLNKGQVVLIDAHDTFT